MKLQIPKTITSVESGWCPGCGHGIVARILTEVAEEMGVSDKVIMVRDVACGAMISNVVTFDNVGGAHGRPIIKKSAEGCTGYCASRRWFGVFHRYGKHHPCSAAK